jgi:hypothetical protein
VICDPYTDEGRAAWGKIASQVDVCEWVWNWALDTWILALGSTICYSHLGSRLHSGAGIHISVCLRPELPKAW